MRTVRPYIFVSLLTTISTAVVPLCAEAGDVGRCRVCVLTDLGGDPDDEQSFVRFVVLSNMYDVEGIVLSPFQSKRRSDCTPYHARDHVNYVLDQYAKVVDRLNRHAAFAGQHAYPSAESLREVVRLGLHGFRFHDEAPETMERFIGDFGDHDKTSNDLMRGMTPGSKLIVEILMKPDPRPVYFCLWGGGATLQQAILEIENNWGPWEFTPQEKQRLLDKVRIFNIDGQDFSDLLFFQVEPQQSRFYYVDCDSFFGLHQRGDRSTLKRAWIDEHIRGHGPLGTVGPDVTNDDITQHPIYPYVKPPASDATYAMKEGDTPSFFGLLANGLSYPDDPRADDWSGQYERAEGRLWDDLDRIQDRRKAIRGIDSIAKWRPHFNADFQARMDWMKQQEVTKANHHPIAGVNGRTHPNNVPVRILVDAAGTTSVRLSAEGSRDPDGDALTYHWRQDAFVDSYDGEVSIANPDAWTTEVTFKRQPGTTIHILLTVTDNGIPNLHAYRRVIVCLGP